MDKIGVRDFKKFCTENLMLIICNILVVFLTFGSRIFTRNVSVDTDLFINNPYSTYNWLDIGRQGLVFTKKIFGTMWYNPYISGVFFLTGIIFFCIIWSYLFNIIRPGQPYFVFMSLFCTHPVFALQYFFQLQAFEITISIILVALALLFIYRWILYGGYANCIIGIVMMIWSFSSYQSNVGLYLAGGLACFILLNEDNLKKILQIIIKLVITFSIGFLINIFITKLFFTHSNYLDNSFAWGKLPISECILNICKHIGATLFGIVSVIYSKAYIILIIFLLILFLIDIKKMNISKFIHWIAIGFLLLSPFFLTFYLGSIPSQRTQITLAFVIGFGYMYVYKCIQNKKWKTIKIICILAIAIFLQQQISTTLRLFYTDDIRYQQDVEHAYKLSSDINKLGLGESPEIPIAFVGSLEANLNNSCFSGIKGTEYFGLSVFEIHYSSEPHYFWNTISAIGFMNTIGIHYKEPTQEQILKARTTAIGMQCWPNEGGIQIKDGIIIIKLSEDIFIEQDQLIESSYN